MKSVFAETIIAGLADFSWGVAHARGYKRGSREMIQHNNFKCF